MECAEFISNGLGPDAGRSTCCDVRSYMFLSDQMHLFIHLKEFAKHFEGELVTSQGAGFDSIRCPGLKVEGREGGEFDRAERWLDDTVFCEDQLGISLSADGLGNSLIIRMEAL